MVVFNGTNFYAEAGGQTADEGKISCGENEMKIIDVQAEDGYVLHYGHMLKGEFKVGDLCTLSIDADHRMKLMANHSATHLTNFALRKVFGESTMQMGSKVDGEKFSFDFYTTKAAESRLVKMVEDSVNIVIDHNVPVFRSSMSLKEAERLRDLVRLETEDYPPSVSVVSVGMPVHSIARIDDRDPTPFRPVSLELCCGTHVLNTGAIEKFVCTNVTSVGHNVKRIVAVTRDAAKEALKNVPLLSTHVRSFEEEMLAVRDRLMETGDPNAAAIAAAANASAAAAAAAKAANAEAATVSTSSSFSSSSSSPSSSSPSSSSPSSPLLPTFDEVEAKLSTLRLNLRSNPLPVDARLELEGRLEEFGEEIARLKHIRELKKKDAIAASIYDQLSRTTTMTAKTTTTTRNEEGIYDEPWGKEEKSGGKFGKFAVRKLVLVLEDYGVKSIQKALARAPRQLQNLNDDQRIPGLFLFRTGSSIFALGYVPDQLQDSLAASEWVLSSLSSSGASPKGTAIKKKLSERLMYFGWIEDVTKPEDAIETTRLRAQEIGQQSFDC